MALMNFIYGGAGCTAQASINLRLTLHPSPRLLHSTLHLISESSAQATPSETPSETSTPVEGETIPLTKSAGASRSNAPGVLVLTELSYAEKKLVMKKENEVCLALKAAKAVKALPQHPPESPKSPRRRRRSRRSLNHQHYAKGR